MTMKKVTVSLPEEVAEGVTAMVEAGTATSFSAYVASATEAGLARDAALAAFRAHTGGPMGGALRERAERALGIDRDAASAAGTGTPAPRNAS
jgi:Arc/MetJ-type ribon-helix-helix transcriptional regulator